ncbi:MAG: prolyl oligopeptidase family serine peptidase [Spirochaetaceae bacterium]|nr:MAG: prolyl oligopeptidase family serine peptidase [Spirochaetaceae bacterium]
MSMGSKLFKAIAGRAPRVRGFTQRFYFGHPFLDTWFAWFPLNQIQYNGAAVGEIYNTAARIDERKSLSWITEWTAEGDRVKEYAEKLLSKDHRISAGNTFLRAFTYFRTAHLATDPDTTGQEMRDTYEKLSYCFDRFRECSNRSIEKVSVPLKGNGKPGTTMHGYFLKPTPDGGSPAPTVLWLSGAESIAEDVYWWCGAEAVDRCYNVFAVDMPGDTATRIYDGDTILAGAGDDALLSQMDYILERPEVDPDNVFVYGISMGGYKAGRLAQQDKRMRGTIANAPMLDASKVLEAVRNVYRAPADAHGWARRMCWQYGVEDRSDLKKALEVLVDRVWGSFTVEPEKINRPFLTLAGENELGGEGIRQALEFHDRVGSEVKEKRIVTVSEGGEAHCQLNNFPLARQIVFDWIEDIRKAGRG